MKIIKLNSISFALVWLYDRLLIWLKKKESLFKRISYYKCLFNLMNHRLKKKKFSELHVNDKWMNDKWLSSKSPPETSYNLTTNCRRLKQVQQQVLNDLKQWHQNMFIMLCYYRKDKHNSSTFLYLKKIYIYIFSHWELNS